MQSSQFCFVSRLPLILSDRVLLTNTLVAYLRLNGSKAREHPVFQELGRVRQYFEKIKLAEGAIPNRATLSLDKDVAARIISAGLVLVLCF